MSDNNALLFDDENHLIRLIDPNIDTFGPSIDTFGTGGCIPNAKINRIAVSDIPNRGLVMSPSRG